MCCLPLFSSLYLYVELSEHWKIKLKFSKLPLKGVRIVFRGFLNVHKAHGPTAALRYVGTTLLEPECFPLLLLPTASVTTLAQDIQGNHILPCAYTAHNKPEVSLWRTGFSKEISPMASGGIHVPCNTSSVKTPQPSDLPCTSDRKDKACLGLPHNIPAGASWERGLKWMKYVFLSWSWRISQGFSTAHQSGVDLVKYLALLLGHLWTRKPHRP